MNTRKNKISTIHKSTRSVWDNIFKFLALPTITALLTIFGNQLFFKLNRETEEKLKFQMERIRVTYPIYNLLKEFAELGIVTKEVLLPYEESKFLKNYNENNSSLLKGFKRYRVPTITVDSSALNQWEAVYNEVILKKDLINSDTYLMAKRIMDFYNGKDSQNNDFLFSSGWKDESRVKEWVALNQKLIERIQKHLALAEYE